MTFTEKKTDTGFHYETEDIFGKIRIDSVKKLTPNNLDTVVMGILQANQKRGEIGQTITFEYEKADEWMEDEITEIREVPKTLLSKLLTFIKKILWI